jgi:hypothetical protein
MRSSHLHLRLRVPPYFIEGPRKATAYQIAMKPFLDNLEVQLANIQLSTVHNVLPTRQPRLGR